MSSSGTGPTPPGNWRPGDYPAAGSPYAPDSILSPAATTNTAGKVSLILGIVLAAAGIASTVVQAQVLSGGSNASAVGAVSGVGSLVQLVLAIGATVTGIVGLRNPGPKGAAGVGTGLGASAIVGIVSVHLIFGLGGLLY